MHSFVETVKQVCERPEMFVGGGSYLEVAALLTGYDLATSGGALSGFREWLTVRLDGGSNLAWPRLVLDAAFPNRESIDPTMLTAGEDRSALDMLCDLVLEFREERAAGGLRRVYLAYHAWLKQQDWYGPDSADWFEPGDGPKGAKPPTKPRDPNQGA